MKKTKLIPLFALLILVAGCAQKEEKYQKGFATSGSSTNDKSQYDNGLNPDTLQFPTRPSSVLLTAHPAHRLTPVYKLNFNKKTKKPYIGTNHFLYNYSNRSDHEGNNWNGNYMPGFEGLHGYNLVNISHFNNQTKTEQQFFENPVLINTCYYPSYSKDTLFGEPVLRNFYMVSAYDEDTNKDGFINVLDLRRFYYFDLEARNETPLVPRNYSVTGSEYDPVTDYMYVFAQLDQNNNGKREYKEESHIFWIDLKNPENRGRQY